MRSATPKQDSSDDANPEVVGRSLAIRIEGPETVDIATTHKVELTSDYPVHRRHRGQRGALPFGGREIHRLGNGLGPRLGYEIASKLAKRAHSEQRTVAEIILEEKLLTKKELSAQLRIELMTSPQRLSSAR